MAGCKATAYYRTPNDVYEKQGLVHMTDGAIKPGLITVSFETGSFSRDHILLKNGNVDEKIKLDSIHYYTLGKDAYHLKKVDVQLNDFKQLLFVKQLTPDSSRMHLYELHQQRSKSSDGRDYYYYFVSFPQDGRLVAQNVSSKYFLPNFDEKVSAMFTSCMPLATKIRNKVKGYFLPAYSLSDQKRVEVWQRILREFNDCK